MILRLIPLTICRASHFTRDLSKGSAGTGNPIIKHPAAAASGEVWLSLLAAVRS